MREHLLSTFKLSLPLIIAQIAQLGLGLTDVAMIGWYGTSELAALTLGHTCLFFIYITLTGFSLAVITNVSKAFGREDIEALRKHLGLSRRSADSIREAVHSEIKAKIGTTCRHCGKPYEPT